jgi:hypothetical protein
MTAPARQLGDSEDAQPVTRLNGMLPATGLRDTPPAAAPRDMPPATTLRDPPLPTPARAPETRQPPAPPPQTPLIRPAPTKRKPTLTPAGAFSIAVAALLYFGWHSPTARYITPKRGIGYALGILGGSLMLLLFLYSARKRIPWLKFMGSAAGWFRFHMSLGVLGPLCILYHANFGLGATNSNVALFSMLTVAGSGLVGRYIYAHIHQGLYGSKLSLGELQKGAEGLRASSGAFGFLPDLVSRLETVERRLLSAGPHLPVLGIAKLAVVGTIAAKARWQLRRNVRRALRGAAQKSNAVATERKRLRRTAFAYIDRRLAATRRVAGFQAYERLFSIWHALHLPLIFILLVAGIAHVIAVHVY